MPLMIEEGVITRITFNKPVAEEPLDESWLRNFLHAFWRLVSGG